MRRIALLAALLLPWPCAAADATDCAWPQGMPHAQLLLLGELHGSEEAPALATRLACAVAADGPAALGLEIPIREQAAIDRYLASDGGAAAKDALVAGDFWQRGRDGRASVAMAAQIERVRRLVRRGLPLTVFAFDSQAAGEDRNVALARTLRQFHADHPGVGIVALMGNIHAPLAPVELGERTLTPSGVLLADLDPYALFIAYRSGSTWACMEGGCKAHEINSTWGSARDPGFTTETPMPGYSAAYVLPGLTASPPAALYWGSFTPVHPDGP